MLINSTYATSYLMAIVMLALSLNFFLVLEIFTVEMCKKTVTFIMGYGQM